MKMTMDVDAAEFRAGQAVALRDVKANEKVDRDALVRLLRQRRNVLSAFAGYVAVVKANLRKFDAKKSDAKHDEDA